MPRPFQLLCLLIGSWLVASAQAQTPAAASTSPAVVTFTTDFPASQPEHYSIRIQSDGSAHYQAISSQSAGADGSGEAASGETDKFDLDFTLTAGTRQKIFDLAAKGGYFQKDVDYHHKGMAFTGKKTLSYKDAQRSGESTYNYSMIPAVQELTNLMQNLAATLDFGPRLQYDLRYQKLALDDELKHMEDLAHSNELVEIKAIQPILNQIIADPSVMNVARARAERLLQHDGER